MTLDLALLSLVVCGSSVSLAQLFLVHVFVSQSVSCISVSQSVSIRRTEYGGVKLVSPIQANSGGICSTEYCTLYSAQGSYIPVLQVQWYSELGIPRTRHQVYERGSTQYNTYILCTSTVRVATGTEIPVNCLVVLVHF